MFYYGPGWPQSILSKFLRCEYTLFSSKPLLRLLFSLHILILHMTLLKLNIFE